MSIVCVLPKNRFSLEKPRGNCVAGNGKSNISNYIWCHFILLGLASTLKAKEICTESKISVEFPIISKKAVFPFSKGAPVSSLFKQGNGFLFREEFNLQF